MREGDQYSAERFSLIFEASYGRLYAYAARRVGREAADDIAAETLLVAWRRRDALPDEPLPWLYGIARNLVARQHGVAERRLVTRRALELERPAPAHEETEDPALAAAWATLGSGDREVLALIAWEELSVRDAARSMGCSAPVFSVRLHRARRRFEAALDRGGAQRRSVPDLAEAP